MYKIILIILLNFLFAEEIRKPCAAGGFYPNDKKELTRMIETYLNKAQKKEVQGEIIGILVPHAGYVYSGPVAAYGYKLLEGKKYERVILIGPSHHAPIKGVIMYDKGYFATPFGNIEIDKKFCDKLKKCKYIKEDKGERFKDGYGIEYTPHEREHSLEVQLPFLQKVLSNSFKIVPLLVNNINSEICEEISEIIKSNIGDKKTLIIISSDMSHYPKYEDANKIDNETLEIITQFNPYKLAEFNSNVFYRGIENLDCILCGEAAVILGMYILKGLGANNAIKIHYANSGDVPYGDKNRVVGYGVVAFSLIEEKFTKEDFIELLTIARSIIKNFMNSKFYPNLIKSQSIEKREEEINKFLSSKDYKKPTTQNKKLLLRKGVFVTLKENEELRGCIGRIISEEPIIDTVGQMALASAFLDYRFSPLKKEELDKIKIEISILSEIKKIKSINDIKLGIHGVILKKGNRQGLFLPQVAREHPYWSKEEFLEELSIKAGLPPSAYKEADAEFFIFTVENFSE